MASKPYPTFKWFLNNAFGGSVNVDSASTLQTTRSVYGKPFDGSADVTGAVPISNGGTNSSAPLTNDRFMVSSNGAIVEAPALTDGQLYIGRTGASPIPTTITAGTGITVTNSSGNITVSQNTSSSSALKPFNENSAHFYGWGFFTNKRVYVLGSCGGNPVRVADHVSDYNVTSPLPFAFNDGYKPVQIKDVWTTVSNIYVHVDDRLYSAGFRTGVGDTNLKRSLQRVNGGSLAGLAVERIWSFTRTDDAGDNEAHVVVKATNKTYHFFGGDFGDMNGLNNTMNEVTSPTLYSSLSGLDLTFNVSNEAGFCWVVSPTGGSLRAFGDNSAGGAGVFLEGRVSTWTRCLDYTGRYVDDALDVQHVYAGGWGRISLVTRYQGGSKSLWFTGVNNVYQGGNGTTNSVSSFNPCYTSAGVPVVGVKKVRMQTANSYALLDDGTLLGAGGNYDYTFKSANSPNIYFQVIATNIEDFWITEHGSWRLLFYMTAQKEVYAVGHGWFWNRGVGDKEGNTTYSAPSLVKFPPDTWPTRIERTGKSSDQPYGGMVAYTNNGEFYFWGRTDAHGAAFPDIYLVHTPTKHPNVTQIF